MSNAVKIEYARGRIRNAISEIKNHYGIEPCIMDGILSSMLSEVREEIKVELLNETNEIIKEKDEELKKAKEAAKKVLKQEQQTVAFKKRKGVERHDRIEKGNKDNQP